jgi:hypothetical protein
MRETTHFPGTSPLLMLCADSEQFLNTSVLMTIQIIFNIQLIIKKLNKTLNYIKIYIMTGYYSNTLKHTRPAAALQPSTVLCRWYDEDWRHELVDVSLSGADEPGESPPHLSPPVILLVA